MAVSADVQPLGENSVSSEQGKMEDGAPQDSVQLPYQWLNSMVYGGSNYSAWAFKPAYHWGV